MSVRLNMRNFFLLSFISPFCVGGGGGKSEKKILLLLSLPPTPATSSCRLSSPKKSILAKEVPSIQVRIPPSALLKNFADTFLTSRASAIFYQF